MNKNFGKDLSEKLNFNQRVRRALGEQGYREACRRGGRNGSPAGHAHPYARASIPYARLFSPVAIGRSIVVTPKHTYRGCIPGTNYSWYVIEQGLGTINGKEFSAQEVSEHFIVRKKKND